MKTQIPIIRNHQTVLKELKNTLEEINKAITSINSSSDRVEKMISELENWSSEITQEDKNEKKNNKEWTNIKKQDYVKIPNLWLIGIPDSKEGKLSKLEHLPQDTVHEKFPNLTKGANIQMLRKHREPLQNAKQEDHP